MNSSSFMRRPPIRLSEFTDPEVVYDSLQGHGNKGVLTSRSTHQGVEVSGKIPSAALPPDLFVKYREDNSSNFNNAANLEGNSEMTIKMHELADHNYFLNSQRTQKMIMVEPPPSGGNDDSETQRQISSPSSSLPLLLPPPPKQLGWLHSVIENFYDFRNRQFQLKHSSGILFALSDDDDRAAKMIVPSPITDDVAFHIFEMVSERYGVPSVVAQQCDMILRTAQFFASRDVSAALFYALLRTPNFDSNDVRFVVEARKSMRSSLVSQRGVDGILRWFIPLRSVPHVIRKACEHPWARPVLSKIHSAFEKLFIEQRRKQITDDHHHDNNNNNSNNAKSSGPLFVLPAPSKLILVPPFGKDHPLIGRGPFVDIRGNEMFLGSQPAQLVIGADYLLCMLFCNWLDHRENAVVDVAEGKPIRSITNRRQGRISTHKTLNEAESTTVNKLSMFAMDIDEDTGEFVQGLLKDPKYKNRFAASSDNGDGDAATSGKGDDVVDSKNTSGGVPVVAPLNRHTTISDLTALAQKYYRDNNKSNNNNVDEASASNGPSKNNNEQNENGNNKMGNGRSDNRKHQQQQSPKYEMVPPRVLHLYTKQNF